MHRNVIFFLYPRENINFFFVFIYFHLEICEKISICLFVFGGGPDIWEKIIYPIPSPLPTLFTVYLTPSLLLPLTDPLVIRRNILKHKTKFQNFFLTLPDGISFGSKRFWAVYAGIVKLNAFCHMNRVSAQWWTLKVSPGSSFCLQSPPRRF